MDEVLPPLDNAFGEDIYEEEDDGYDGVAVTFALDDANLNGNYTEEWFASSKKPRRVRPSKVGHASCLLKLLIVSPLWSPNLLHEEQFTYNLK